MSEECPKIRRRVANEFKKINNEAFQQKPLGEMRRVVLLPERRCEGMFAIFFAGHYHATNKEGVLEVCERTLGVLDEMGILYSAE